MPEQRSQFPDQTYTFGTEKLLSPLDVPYEVHDLVERIDQSYRRDMAGHFQWIIDAGRPPAVAGGAPYAVFRDEDSSQDTALVVTLPYCNPVIPDIMDAKVVARAVVNEDSKAFDSNTWNNGEKHAFLFDVMRTLDIRDSAGKNIPVIAVGADSQDYQPVLDLSRKQQRALRKGSLDVYVKNVEDILEREGYGKIHAAGYSQGASVAHGVLAGARNIDVAGAVLAEMPTYKDRSIGALAVNYLLNKPAPKNNSGIKSDEKWTADGPLSRQELEAIQNRAAVTMAQTIVMDGAWRTALALRHGTMVSDLAEAVDKRGVFPLTIAWNGTSSLTHDIETTLFAPDSPDKPVLDKFRAAKLLRTAKAVGHEAVGAPHLAGESPMYYALLMAQSVAWANAQASS